MSENESAVIAAVKANDTETLAALVVGPAADLDSVDENGWTALCWAASQGNLPATEVLCAAGANVFKCGEDQRSPYKIALAASHRAVAQRLREAERAAGGDLDRTSSRENEDRLYCKAFRAAELSQFPHWMQLIAGEAPAPEEPVFVHQNYVVTRSIWHDKDIVLANVTDEWRTFCVRTLGFRVPDDFDLLAV